MATAAAPKQWGLTPPLSTDLPQQVDNDRTAELIEELKRENNYETSEATDKRIKTLQLLSKTTLQLVQEVSRKKGYPQNQIDKFGGKIFPYGSYRLGVYGPGSDIDTLAVAPKHITRDDFFEFFPNILRKTAGKDGIQSMVPVPDAFVPIIKLVLNNIEIDLIFVSVPTLASIEKTLTLDDNKHLVGLDQQAIKSITGPRVTDQILASIPEPRSFRTALRAIKLWAQRRAIYANIVGYPGGVAWAMLVARVCQLYPHAVGGTLVLKFFSIYRTWNWPTPVMLKEIEPGSEKTWNPVLYSGDRKNLMPIITPAYPSMCATYNMTKSGKTVILKEISRGYDILDEIFQGRSAWSKLFEKHTFFTKDFRYYISVVASSQSAEEAKKFSGLVESKLRFLVAELEKISDQISLARPFTKGYYRMHKVNGDTEAAEVRKGMMKYKVDEVKTVENSAPDLVTNGGGVAPLLEGDFGGSKEANYFTYSFYIGIVLTTAATKNLNISHPISHFKETCKSQWPPFKSDQHFIDVQAVKCWDLPDDMFAGDEKKPVKEKKPAKKPASQVIPQTKTGRSFSEVDGPQVNGTDAKRQKTEHTGNPAASASTNATPQPA